MENNLTFKEKLQQKIDLKTKPVGSLGVLEEIAFRVGCIQNTLSPELKNPTIIIFAGDHGLTDEKISPFPKEVTWQMVMNFLGKGAAISVFSEQNGINLKIVDAGVDYNFENISGLEHSKIDWGTKNCLNEPAMTAEQCKQAMDKGAEHVRNEFKKGCNIIGFGEMGIGNTSLAALLMSKFTSIPVEDCAGRGTGLDDDGLNHKISVLKKVSEKYADITDPIEALTAFGGFEIAMLTGAYLEAYRNEMTILVDGFIATSALIVAKNINEKVLDNCIFCHKSEERGHTLMLEHLNAYPILHMKMRLGEGTGAAVAYPMVKTAITFLNKMASFESAGVSNK